jgi:protoporphyrinogen oxidase
MSETLHNNEYDLLIVGGGITGLAAAYLAARQGKKVGLVEKSSSFGGLLNTFEIGGNRLEYFYHHFFTHDAELNWLIRELDLADKLVFQKTSMGVFREGKIYDFNVPSDLLKFKPISWLDKFRFGLSSLFMGKVGRWEQYEHVSAAAWLRKWAGKTTAEALWMPLLKIKFGPYAEQVPLAWMIGRLRQRMGSRDSGDERLGYLDGSLDTLLQRLLSELQRKGVDLLADTEIASLRSDGNSVQSLVLKNGEELQAKQFLFTLPSMYFADLIAPVLPEYAQATRKIKYFGAVCLVLEMRKSLSPVYWLNIAEDNYPFGGIIEHTNLVAPSEYQGRHIAYLSRYFAHEEAVASMDEAALKALMLPRLKEIYPHFDEADLIQVHCFRTNTAATVCDLNFSKKVLPCQTPLQNAYIANMSHIYPDERSVNNSIRIAAEALNKIGIDASCVPYNRSLSGKIGF